MPNDTTPFSETKTFDPLDYFDGSLTAWGIFEDRFGTVRRRFQIAIEGRREGAFLLLDETLQYDDGEVESRHWRVERTSPGRFRGTSPDVIGYAVGIQDSRGTRMRYRLNLKTGNRTLSVDLDDRLYAIDSTRAVNRARLSKWGVTLGEVSMFFERRPALGLRAAAAAA